MVPWKAKLFLDALDARIVPDATPFSHPPEASHCHEVVTYANGFTCGAGVVSYDADGYEVHTYDGSHSCVSDGVFTYADGHTCGEGAVSYDSDHTSATDTISYADDYTPAEDVITYADGHTSGEVIVNYDDDDTSVSDVITYADGHTSGEVIVSYDNDYTSAEDTISYDNGDGNGIGDEFVPPVVVPPVLPIEFRILILQAQITVAAETVTATAAKLKEQAEDLLEKIDDFVAAKLALENTIAALKNAGLTGWQILANGVYILSRKACDDASDAFATSFGNKKFFDRELVRVQDELLSLQKQLNDLEGK